LERSKRRIHQGGNNKYTKYSIRRSGSINKIWNKIQKGINEAVGQIIGKDERPQRNSRFDKECQRVLEVKKRAYNKMIKRNITENEQEYQDRIT
jgi:hypothetical protein